MPRFQPLKYHAYKILFFIYMYAISSTLLKMGRYQEVIFFILTSNEITRSLKYDANRHLVHDPRDTNVFIST